MICDGFWEDLMSISSNVIESTLIAIKSIKADHTVHS